MMSASAPKRSRKTTEQVQSAVTATSTNTTATGAAAQATPHRSRFQSLPVALLLGALILLNIAGASYYLAPNAARPRHPWHAFLKPSGAVGQSAGILAFVIFLFLWLYPLRKRWRALAFTGAIARWLDVHVTLAIGLPLLLTVHATWRADGIIGLGFGAMLVVCASGIIGRYLYARIPRARSGVELTREEVSSERDSLLTEIAAALGEPVKAVALAITPVEREAVSTVWQVIERLVLDDMRRFVRVRQLTVEWASRPGVDRKSIARVAKLAAREMALTDQMRTLEGAQRVFRYWHIAHLPFALTALLAVTVHVVVVIAMGATWFW